jgi:hypothetical protein
VTTLCGTDHRQKSIDLKKDPLLLFHVELTLLISRLTLLPSREGPALLALALTGIADAFGVFFGSLRGFLGPWNSPLIRRIVSLFSSS